MKRIIFNYLRPLIDGLITERILVFYERMVADGQIMEMSVKGPSVSSSADSFVAPGRRVGLGVAPKQV